MKDNIFAYFAGIFFLPFPLKLFHFFFLLHFRFYYLALGEIRYGMNKLMNEMFILKELEGEKVSERMEGGEDLMITWIIISRIFLVSFFR